MCRIYIVFYIKTLKRRYDYKFHVLTPITVRIIRTFFIGAQKANEIKINIIALPVFHMFIKLTN